MPPKRKAAPRKTKAQAAAEAKAQAEAQAAAAEAQAVEEANVASEAVAQEEKEEETVTVKTTTMTTETVITTTTTVITTEDEPENDSNSKKKELEDVSEMPEKKKTSRSKRKAKDEEETVVEATATAEEQQTPVTPSDQDTEMKEVEAESSSSASSSSAPAPAKANGAPLSMAERMEKLKGLRQKMNASKQANRTDLMAEHQKSKVNHREEAKKARAREAAEEMIAKQEAEEAGEDYERSQFWNYSAESVERWNEKQEAKRVRMDNKFTDWDQMNHKKYLKQVGELKPNLAAYNAKKEAAMHVNEDGELVVASDSGFYRDANSVAFLSDTKPNTLAVDRLAADVVKQIEARSKFSKRRAHKEDEDVNYINDANQRFNQKIARFYDKHTKEIRDDFERGTALATKDKKSEKLGRSDGDASGTDDTNDHDSNSGSDEDEEESDVYEVEKVVGHRREQAAGGGGNVLFYHIKWKDYPDSDSTWEISSQVFCKDMVDEYWKQYLDLGGKKTDPYGDLKKQTSSLLSLNGKRKLDPSSSSATHSGKGGSKSGKASGRSGSISEEPLLPDLSPLVKSSSAAAVATTARGAQGGTQSTSFKRARTNSPERQQSTMVTISTSATSTLTASSTVAKSSRKESVPRKLTSVGPVLITDENWTPPDNWNTWDDHVERVEAIETRSLDRHDKSTMFVHLRWKTGNRFTLHPLSEIHIKAPHKLIEFYERHLQFQESSNA
ncbi:hypothetical protein EC991_009549 [Linnemannia zychae]|nr:hypothetical protein EC991_009549 [Linnemannia zychae]